MTYKKLSIADNGNIISNFTEIPVLIYHIKKKKKKFDHIHFWQDCGKIGTFDQLIGMQNYTSLLEGNLPIFSEGNLLDIDPAVPFLVI